MRDGSVKLFQPNKYSKEKFVAHWVCQVETVNPSCSEGFFEPADTQPENNNISS